jgi:ketosteroid isomerase-like protein
MRLPTLAILSMGALMLLAMPALAADDSDMAGQIVMWESEYNADNVEGLVAMYTADACRMPPNLEPVNGSEAIMAQIMAGKEAGAAKVKLGLNEAVSSGEMGWASGTWATMDADGNELDHGKWMNVSKMVDGMWKIHCYIWSSNLPVEGME